MHTRLRASPEGADPMLDTGLPSFHGRDTNFWNRDHSGKATECQPFLPSSPLPFGRNSVPSPPQAPFPTVTPQQDRIDLIGPHFSLLIHRPPNMQVPSSRGGEDHCWFGFRGGKRMREIQADACGDWQFSLVLSVSCGPRYGNVHQGGGFDARSLRKPFHNYRESAETPQIQIVNDIPGTRFLL